jgi:uncharacterized protein YjiS (DUF1127 family)
MEDIDNATALTSVTQQRLGRRPIRALCIFVRAALQAVRSRRELASMDDRLRADIGISRGEALMESRRSAWDLKTRPDPTRRSRGG